MMHEYHVSSPQIQNESKPPNEINQPTTIKLIQDTHKNNSPSSSHLHPSI